ncbi:MAG: WD40 repeat domain-containing protein [Chloroflexota bacterium]
MRILHKLLAFITILICLDSCGPLTPVAVPQATSLVAATPTIKPLSPRPPEASLEISGKTQQAGIGSYCWSNGIAIVTQTLCADGAGIPTAREPLIAENTPYTAIFHLPLESPPDSLTVSVMPAVKEVINGSKDQRLWGTSQGWSGSLPLKKDNESTFQESPGLYVIQLDARWKDWGSVRYGFLVQVGHESPPQQPFVTPAPTTNPIVLKTIVPLTRLGKGNVLDIALSKDGNWLAVGTSMGVYVLETATQKEIWFRSFASEPRYLAFSPDGKQISVGQAGNMLPILDAKTGQTLMTLQGEEGIHGSWSPDGKSILTSAGCQQVLVWNATTGQVLHTVQPAKCNNVTPGFINAAWSYDGKRIYGNVNNGFVLAWDVVTLLPLDGYKPQPPQYSFGLNIAPAPHKNIFALEDGLSVAIMDGETGKIIKSLQGERQDLPVSQITWSPDGKQIAAGNGDRLLVWDFETGKEIASIKDVQVYAGLAWMPDNQTLTGLILNNGSLVGIQLATGKTLFALGGFGLVNANSAPGWDGNVLLTFDGKNEIRWEPETGAKISMRETSQPAWLSTDYAARSPDGRLIASPNIIRGDAGLQITQLRDASQYDKVAWSPDGNKLVSGSSLSNDQTVIWDAHSGNVLLRPVLKAGNTNPYLGALSWSPNGKWIAAGGSLMNPDNGSNAGFIALWDAHTGEQVMLFTAGMASERIQSLAWSPDNHWLAAGSTTGKIFLWDMQSQLPFAILNGHVDQVLGLSWSPTGELLASSAIDGTVLVWRIP